jgi:hypothetical protein
MEQYRGATERGRGQQVDDVRPHPLGGVVPVDEDEVDVATLGLEATHQVRNQLPAVADVQLGVCRRRDLRLGDVDRMDLLAVSGDALQAATLGRADLDCESRLELAEKPFDDRSLPQRHLPAIA